MKRRHRDRDAAARPLPEAAESWLAVTLWVLLASAALLFVWRNVPDLGIWYDEGVQLFISVGQAPFGPLGQPDGGLRGVHAVNGSANLDPGGFSLLLFGWLLIDDGIAWARVLPVLLFALGVAAAIDLARRWGPTPWVPLGAAALLALDPLVLLEVTEIRAYTLEIAGVVATIWALERFLARRSPVWAVLAGAAMSLAAVARYSGLLVAAATGMTLLVLLWLEQPTQRPVGLRWRTAARRAVPVLALPVAAAVATALLSGRQLLRRVTYGSGELIAYLDPHLAGGGSVGNRLGLAASNLLGLHGLPLTLAAGVVCWSWASRRGGFGREAPASLGGRLGDRESLLVFGSGAVALAMSIAVWRVHPWDLSQKWSLYLRVLSLLCAVRFLAVAAGFAKTRRAVAGLAAVAALAGAFHLARFERGNPRQVVDALAWLGARDEAAGATGAVVVGVHALPPLRYLCERERVAGCERYPEGFALPIAGQPDPLEAPVGYVISVEGREVLGRRLAPLEVEADGLPPNLFRVFEPADR